MLSKRIIQILAFQLKCGHDEITRELIAKVPYWTLRQMPEIGQASLRAIRAWMREAGYQSVRDGWVKDELIRAPESDLKGELMRVANLMTSMEADFENRTWKFCANHFRCGGGEYVIIPKVDWDRIWSQHEASHAT